MYDYSSHPPSYPSIPFQSFGRTAAANPPVEITAVIQNMSLNNPIFSPPFVFTSVPEVQVLFPF